MCALAAAQERRFDQVPSDLTNPHRRYVGCVPSGRPRAQVRPMSSDLTTLAPWNRCLRRTMKRTTLVAVLLRLCAIYTPKGMPTAHALVPGNQSETMLIVARLGLRIASRVCGMTVDAGSSQSCRRLSQGTNTAVRRYNRVHEQCAEGQNNTPDDDQHGRHQGLLHRIRLSQPRAVSSREI